MAGSINDHNLSRRAFLQMGTLAGVGLAVAPGMSWLGASPALAASTVAELPVLAGEFSVGNQKAMEMAAKSDLVKAGYAMLLTVADAIQDAKLKQATLDMLANPAPTYQLASATAADKTAVREKLLAEKLIPEATTLEGIFVPVNDAQVAPQAFWSGPGSGYGSHHSYPGGLAVHVAYNATIARQMIQNYDNVYGKSIGADSMPMNVDFALAAPLWHDMQKGNVIQWNEDGSLFAEQQIAGTGAHHPLSGAEAIARGLPARFVLSLLSAHSAPGLDTAAAVVDYARAAAIIAGVDPIDYGLIVLDAEGKYQLNPQNLGPDAFINYLSDHDWVLSVHAAHVMIPELQAIAAETYGIDAATDPAAFNAFRNQVFSTLSQIRLYSIFVESGRDAVVKAIAPIV